MDAGVRTQRCVGVMSRELARAWLQRICPGPPSGSDAVGQGAWGVPGALGGGGRYAAEGFAYDPFGTESKPGWRADRRHALGRGVQGHSLSCLSPRRSGQRGE